MPPELPRVTIPLSLPFTFRQRLYSAIPSGRRSEMIDRLIAAELDRLEAGAARPRLQRNRRRPHVKGAVPALVP